MNNGETTDRLLKRLEKHSGWTYEHSMRVNTYAMKIGCCLGLESQEMETLSTASRLHDIGKIAVSASLLDRETALTEKEYGSIKRHTIYGYLLLKSLGYPQIICEAVCDHHERFDGRGYGAKINMGIAAKIICGADSYDAMKYGRPYRLKLTDKEIYKDITGNNGKQFDPDVCDAMLRVLF